MNKIDLIIDALETSKPINQESSIPFDKHLKALAAARELRELELVGQTQASSALPSTRNQQATCVCPKCLRMRNE